MDINDMQDYVNGIIEEKGLPPIDVDINYHLTVENAQFGYKTKAIDKKYDRGIEISINEELLYAEKEFAEQILLHEIAHYICFERYEDYLEHDEDGHGEYFKTVCKELNCKEDTPYSVGTGRFKVRCGHCGETLCASPVKVHLMEEIEEHCGDYACAICGSDNLCVVDDEDCLN